MNAELDQKVIDAFLRGSVEGLDESVRAEHIKTQISHVFLYPNSAYKLYRHDNTDFNKAFVDLDQESTRKQFYEEDFFYNNYYNPKVYLSLMAISLVEDKVSISNGVVSPYDWVIKMARINAEDNLARLLINGELVEEDFRKIGYQMTKEVAEFPGKAAPARTCYELMVIDLNDAEEFAYFADPSIKRNDTAEIMASLRRYLDQNRARFESVSDFVFSLDNHSDNVFYNNGKVSFIDIYPPKEDWRITERLYVIYRLSVDVEVLTDQKNADALIQGYKDYYGQNNLDQSLRLFYQIYAAMIRGAHLFLVSRETGKGAREAEKFLEFAHDNISKL